MKFDRPDRSNFVPNFVKTEENPQLDIGWNEGFLSDGRPYRMEAWCEDQITSVTFFFSTDGLETLSNEQFAELLEREALLRYVTPRRSAYAMVVTDPSGNGIWSVNVVIGDEDRLYADGGPVLRPYGRPNAGAS